MATIVEVRNFYSKAATNIVLQSNEQALKHAAYMHAIDYAKAYRRNANKQAEYVRIKSFMRDQPDWVLRVVYDTLCAQLPHLREEIPIMFLELDGSSFRRAEIPTEDQPLVMFRRWVDAMTLRALAEKTFTEGHLALVQLDNFVECLPNNDKGWARKMVRAIGVRRNASAMVHVLGDSTLDVSTIH